MDAQNSPQHTLALSLLERFPEEAVSIVETASHADVVAFLETLPPEQSARFLGLLTSETAANVLEKLEGKTARSLMKSLEPNRVANLLARMEEGSRSRLLGLLSPALAKEVGALMAYPVDTAGHFMDPRVLAFSPKATVRDVIRRLRTIRRRRIQDIYLVDQEGKLVGSLALQDVILAKGTDGLDSLVRGVPPSVSALAPRDEVLEALEKHRARSLPVVDIDGVLLGVLRQGELIAAVEESAASAMVTMVGASKEERALSSPLLAVRKRLPWLEVNLLTAFLAASVVGIFEGTIARFTALAVLLPVVAGQSGNTGAQALAVTMRGLALREVRVRHWLRLEAKELLAGAINGLAVAITTSLAVFVWSRSLGLSLVIGVSMVLSMTLAGMAGAGIPIMLTTLKQDPAQSSSIILTTVTDIVGFFSFLGIATLLSGML
jgi:magnesium transporter